VKTRLSPALPAALAHDLYVALLADTLAAGEGCRARERTLWWAGDGAPPETPGWASRRQEGADLGARLAHAAAASWRGAGDRVVLAGTDAPALSAAHLDAAFAALESHDVALGPAGDGGYWAIGLARRAEALFEGIEWSTGRVLAQALERARALGASVAMLPRLDDLDTPADLARWIGALARGEPACGTHARAWLREVGLSR